MKKSIAMLALSSTLLFGCASIRPAPDWVSGAASAYAPMQYLVGRGQATTSEDARDRARADLVKTFEVSVTVESEDMQAFRSAEGGQYEGRSTRQILTRTDRVVEGVEIAETWQNPVTNDYYALAVLPRLKAASALRQEIARLDDATRLQLGRAREANDLLLKIAAAATAVSMQTDRAALQKSLRVIDASGIGVEPSLNLDKLRADLDALLKRIKLVPLVTTDSSSGLEPITKGALAAAGFLADTSDKPDYLLEASLDLDDLGRQDGWYWQRGTLEVRLIESANQRVRGTRRWSVKSSALAYDSAVKRALAEADGILKKELRATIVGFTAGQVDK